MSWGSTLNPTEFVQIRFYAKVQPPAPPMADKFRHELRLMATPQLIWVLDALAIILRDRGVTKPDA